MKCPAALLAIAVVAASALAQAPMGTAVSRREDAAAGGGSAGRAGENAGARPVRGAAAPSGERGVSQGRGPAEPGRIGILLAVQAVNLIEQGRYSEAESLIVRSLALLSTSAAKQPHLGRLWAHLGQIRWGQGRLGEAQRFYEHALDLERRDSGDNDPEVTVIRSNLAAVYDQRRQPELAKKCLEKVRAAASARGEPSALERAEALQGQAAADLIQGQPQKARRALLRALAILERSGPSARRLMASVLTCLGDTEGSLRQYRRARARLERALRLAESEFGAEHPAYASTLVKLAVVEEALGLDTPAEDSLQRAAVIQAASLGSDSPALARTVLKHASLLAKLGRSAEARDMERKARAILAREAAEDFRISFEQLKAEASR